MALLSAVAVLGAAENPAGAAPGDTERASLTSSGTEASGDSRTPAVSADGRYVAFWSYAPLVLPDDFIPDIDIFVRDRVSGTTERLTTGTGGPNSFDPAITPDGRFVAFQSATPDLVSGDTNNRIDIFVRDRNVGSTERINVDSNGTQANGDSFQATISDDGRFVAFQSSASNLVSGDTNSCDSGGPGTCPDIFVLDRQTHTTERVSTSTSGTEGNDRSAIPFISGNGRYVSFESLASNLVNNDTNEVSDIFVHDRMTGTTERASVTSQAAQGNDGATIQRSAATGVTWPSTHGHPTFFQTTPKIRRSSSATAKHGPL